MDHGVRVRLGTTVTAVRGHGRVTELELTDGSVLPADLVIEGLGAAPATGIQVVGRPRPDDAVTVTEDSGQSGHVAIYERDGAVSGVFTIDSPKVMLMGRHAILGRLSRPGIPRPDFCTNPAVSCAFIENHKGRAH